MPPPSLPGFTKEQKDHISSFIKPFEAFLRKHNEAGTRDRDTSQWVKDTVHTIMTHECMSINELEGRDITKVQGQISTYFRNWKNNNYKHNIAPVLMGTKPAPIHSTNSDACHIPKAVLTSMNNAMRGLVVLDCDMTPKQLFYLQEPQHYTKKYHALRDRPENKNQLPCTISQWARTQAWNETDQDYWAKKKQDLEQDAEGNRAIFPDMLRASIQQNLNRGVVGTALVGVMIAFRTENGIEHGISYSGYDSINKREIAHFPTQHDELTKIWTSHADKFMPMFNSSLPSVYEFERTENGFPILPSVDLEGAISEIKNVLTAYFESSWETTYPKDSSLPSLPWNLVFTSPELYYDYEAFKLPGLLGNPIPCKPSNLIGLYERLLELQDEGNHFRFFTRAQIREILQEHLDEASAEQEKDNENVEVDHSTKDAIQPPSPPALVPTVPNSPLPGSQLPNPTTAPPTISNSPATAALSPIHTPAPPAVIPKSPSLTKDKSGVSSPTPPVVANIPSPSTPSPLATQRRINEIQYTPTPSPTTKSPVDASSDAPPQRKRPAVYSSKKGGKGVSDSQRRSTRARNAVQFGVQYVANGARSPKSRKPRWEYIEEEDYIGADTVQEGKENRAPKKARLA
ncbi:hypothetical protein CVT24_011332 [Panaeolus cyanescens]|uniref:Uncharacterized protein n=1 Tax=Panaeolus cyanescens TaxID=181874 RepID=A0A409YV00_9AGAR|nr:hypothetical protein CVT24_011332 [Panaeolus cyanescens]